MAINLETQYPGKVAPSSPSYPFGAARNITTPGDGTGTPWEAALANDNIGFQQALLSAANIVPSGSPDNASASQYLQALQYLFGDSRHSPAFGSIADMQNGKPIGGANNDVTFVAGMSAIVFDGDVFTAYKLASSGALPDVPVGSLWAVAQRLDASLIKNLLGQNPIRSAQGGVANTLAFNWDYGRRNILLLGDSITAGVGTSVPRFSYASNLGMAIARHFDQGYNYPLHNNIGNGEAVYTSDGTVISTGLSLSAVSITPAQSITFTDSEAIAAFVLYDGAQSTATSVELHVNGVSVVSDAVGVGTLEEAFLVKNGQPWTSADTVEIKAVGGDLVVFSAAPAKRAQAISGASPIVITNGASGETFQFYRNNIAKIGVLQTAFSGVTPTIAILALGTNSIYNATKAETPSEYVASMTALADEIIAQGASEIIFTIPPQAIETTWPIIKAGYSYQDYVDAIKAAVLARGDDLIDLNIPNLRYSDGVHPDAVGHIALAKHWCEFLGIEPKFERPYVQQTQMISPNPPVLMQDAYVSMDRSGRVSLTGTLQPNGAGTTLLATLDSRYAPKIQRKFVVPLAPNGFGHLTVDPNGEIRMFYNSIAWTDAYLDGVTY